MTTTTYKGYTIVNVGISQYIYRPGRITRKDIGKLPAGLSDGYEQSLTAAKRWVNKDLVKQNESAYYSATN